ncbi:MAG: winged helix-turn-helix domain-containing protein [Actinomycetes bacterium]
MTSPAPLTAPPAVAASLSTDEARRAALRAQGLLGSSGRRGGVPGMLRRLGAVQLDTISVLARSHELVPYARLGAVGRRRVEAAYWGHRPARTFEYWSHAACVLPVEEWPFFAFRRREFRRRGRRWHQVDEKTCREVLARLRADGPLTATDLGGAKAGGPWWDWSSVKIAVEWLLDLGEVVVTERRGWRRVYDLPERALPPSVLGIEASDEECVRRLVCFAGRAMGVATVADLADYHRLAKEQVARAVPDSGLLPVEVDGWRQAAWADPEVLEAPVRGRHRTTLLSPFDSLVWDRPRTRRLFGFAHALEAYKPRGKRVYGYFAMPVLAGGRLVGRVDPSRQGATLVARHVSLETARGVEPVADALAEAAGWVGCDAVGVERVTPASLDAPVRAAVATRTG